VTTHNLYSEHADTIESVLAYTRRAHRLSADDADEFSSWARLRLLEDDCAILRKFQGLSSFKTFLVTVIQRLFLDWRIKEWGKWRPSAEARRLGPVAIELERLVLRDDIDFDQAAQLLVSKGTATSERECEEAWAQLRQRPARRRASAEVLVQLPAPRQHTVEDDERRARGAAVLGALRKAMAELPASDQLIVKLRYDDRFTVARIAKLIDVEQKSLYRRYEQVWKQLRLALQGAGISEEDVRDLFEEGLDEDLGGLSGNGGSGPSSLPNAGGVRV
jgi:RNA polymerase sigma factor (sigma-70 family)